MPVRPPNPPTGDHPAPGGAMTPDLDPTSSPALEVEFASMTGRLLRWERQQAALAAVGHRALVAGDLEEVLSVAAELAAETLDVDFVEIREHTGRGLLLRTGFGWSPGYLGVDHEQGAVCQAGYTYRRPEQVVVTDLATETRFAPSDLLIEHGVRSGISVVLPDGSGGLFGVIAAHTHLNRGFDEDDTAFLAALAGLLGDVIARARETEALVAREAALSALVEHDRSVVWMTDPTDGSRTYTSPGYDALWGRPRAGLDERPTDWLAAIGVDDVPAVLAALEGLPLGEYDVTYRVHRPDGSSRLIHDRAALVLDDDGHLTRIVGLAEDVTDRDHR
jgi:PAS domain-containing protein